jgi:hypothetical protein
LDVLLSGRGFCRVLSSSNTVPSPGCRIKTKGEIEKVIVIGLVANTCIESTVRFAMKIGYHVTLS